MKTIIKPRQGGKTTDLIRVSAETQYPIIARHTDACRRIKKMAEDMVLDIPEPVSIQDAMNTKRLKPGRVLVDDADFVLDYLLQHVCGCMLDTLTMVQRNEKGHEINVYGEDINVKYELGD